MRATLVRDWPDKSAGFQNIYCPGRNSRLIDKLLQDNIRAFVAPLSSCKCSRNGQSSDKKWNRQARRDSWLNGRWAGGWCRAGHAMSESHSRACAGQCILQADAIVIVPHFRMLSGSRYRRGFQSKSLSCLQIFGSAVFASLGAPDARLPAPVAHDAAVHHAAIPICIFEPCRTQIRKFMWLLSGQITICRLPLDQCHSMVVNKYFK